MLQSGARQQVRRKQHSGLTYLIHDQVQSVTTGMSRFMNKLNEARNIKKSQKKLYLEGQRAYLR